VWLCQDPPRPPRDKEKIKALNRRFGSVRNEVVQILGERGEAGKLVVRELLHRLRYTEDFDTLPPECRDLILEAERRQAEK
jgi:hypothetical protein